MKNIKYFPFPTFSSMDWGKSLLALQNEEEQSSFCDLKFICSDGYVLAHKALIPNYCRFQENTQSEEGSSDSTRLLSSTSNLVINLTNLTLVQVSKLLLLIYTGEAIVSKTEQQQLKSALELLQISRVRRANNSPRNTTITVRTRRNHHAIRNGRNNNNRIAASSGVTSSAKEELAHPKIRAVKFDGDSTTMGYYENIFIFGDGTIMAIPLPSVAAARDATLFYDENGDLVEEQEKGFFCSPCSLIFCDSSDFLEHSANCGKKLQTLMQQNPPKVIKIEPGFIKVEEIHLQTFYPRKDDEDYTETVTTPGGTSGSAIIGGGTSNAPLNVCLICVSPCKDASELIVHGKQKHCISSEKDYDYGSWTCKLCEQACGNRELSVFLQHVYHCKKEKRLSRKRSISKSPMIRKRLKTETPPDRTEVENAKESLTPSPSTPSLPSPPPQQDEKVSQPLKASSPSSLVPSVFEDTPLIIRTRSAFRIPKINKNISCGSPTADKSTLVDNIIQRAPTRNQSVRPSSLIFNVNPHTTVRSPKALAVFNYNKNNRNPEISKNQQSPLSNVAFPISQNSVVSPNFNALLKYRGVSKPTSGTGNVVNGIKKLVQKGNEDVTSTGRGMKKRTISSNWNCRRCPHKPFSTQREYMHHDCQSNVKKIMISE